jgi:hypothetical protein
MTTPHKATPDQWQTIEGYANQGVTVNSCILELRDRIQSLEANHPAKPDSSPVPAGGLVDRVHSCIVGEPECGHTQARAAIREVAAWLREQHDGDLVAATVLEREAER